MAKRYIGGALVEVKYVGFNPKYGRDEYCGRVIVNIRNLYRKEYCNDAEKYGDTTIYIWNYTTLFAPNCGFGNKAYDSPKAYDEMAQSAVSFGSSGIEDDSYPDKETSEMISEAVNMVMDDQGEYEVLRKRPDGFFV